MQLLWVSFPFTTLSKHPLSMGSPPPSPFRPSTPCHPFFNRPHSVPLVSLLLPTGFYYIICLISWQLHFSPFLMYLSHRVLPPLMPFSLGFAQLFSSLIASTSFHSSCRLFPLGSLSPLSRPHCTPPVRYLSTPAMPTLYPSQSSHVQ